MEGLPRRYLWYPRARLLWACVCKCGMKSAEQVFADLPGGRMIVGLKEVDKLRKKPRAICQLVRNPRDRLVSMYTYFHRDVLRHPMPGWTDDQTDEWYYDTWGGQRVGFDTFVRGLPDVVDNHHFRPQAREHEDLANLRWRLDDVANFWRIMRIKVAPGLPLKFPHLNKDGSERLPVSEMFDDLSPEGYDIYRELYGDDEQFYNKALFLPKV